MAAYREVLRNQSKSKRWEVLVEGHGVIDISDTRDALLAVIFTHFSVDNVTRDIKTKVGD